MLIRLTNSEIASWKTCRRHWYLSTYRRLRRKVQDPAGKPLTLGSRVHDALAAYYEPKAYTSGEAWDAIMTNVHEGIDRDKEKFPARHADIDKEADLAVIMLEGYCQWLEETGEDADLTILASESSLEVELVEGRASLLSKMDAIGERGRDGALVNLEHKTVQTLKAALPLLQTDSQLLTEHLLARVHKARTGEGLLAKGVLYNQLRKVKRTARANPPFYGRELVMHSDEELQSHWRHTHALALQILDARDRLDAGESHHEICPPSPSRTLTWWGGGSFFNDGLYSLMDDGSDWEAAVTLRYEECDPLERYWETVSYEESQG